MVKKTLIRRAYKSWPKKASETERLAKAMHIEDESEAIDTVATPVDDSERTAGLALIREGFAAIGRTEPEFLKHLTTVCRRDIKKIEDLTEIEMKQAIVAAKQWIADRKAKDAKEAATKETQMTALDKQLGLKNENTIANK